MEDDKRRALDALKQGGRSAKKEIKETVAESIDLPTQRQRMAAASKSDLVPKLAMTDSEKQVYNIIVNHLEKTGLLAEVDMIPMTMLAQSLCLYNNAKMLIQDVEDAMAPVGSNGAMTPSAAYLVMKTERKAVTDLLKDLGLDPKSRIKLFSDMVNLLPDDDDSTEDAIFS